MYVTPAKTYRDVIRENLMEHSSLTTEETQLSILDFMMKTHKAFPKDSFVVFDRCPWDNLVYSLYGNSKGTISDEVTAAVISLVRESIKDLDIIFYLQRDPSIPIVDNGVRDIDEDFLDDTDQIFQDLYHQYVENLDVDVFYPKDDCPAILPVEGSTVEERMAYISEFIDYKGDLIQPDESIFSTENLSLMEQMLKDQMSQSKQDDHFKKIIKEVKKGGKSRWVGWRLL